VAEISSNILTAAARFRDASEARRTRDETRQANETSLQNRVNDVTRRDEIAAAEVQRTAQSIRERRGDADADVSRRQKLNGQRQILDTIDGDTRFRQARDDVTVGLNTARDEEAAILAVIESGLEEALALDSVDTFRADQTSGPDFQSFLGERNQRLSLRQIEQRDSQIQQRIDLRIADDNIRSASPGDQRPRGSIVDVSG